MVDLSKLSRYSEQDVPDKLSTASGAAPSYSARAWVNFNGTGTVAIRSAGNVSSITDLGIGTYRVNFVTPMQDINYAVSATGSNYSDTPQGYIGAEGVNTQGSFAATKTVSSVNILITNTAASQDTVSANVIIFR